MNRLGTITRKANGQTILFYERELSHAASEVWKAITDAKVLGTWLCEVDVDLRIGGRFVIYFHDGKEIMNGAIVALEPGRLIEYSWDEQQMPVSRVRWVVEPTGTGTCRLTLTHSLPAGFKDANIVELGGGWHAILDALPHGIDSRLPAYDKNGLAALEARYGELFREARGPVGA
jgi:uncharacterized protein YndB with AHSA1/START domain